MRRIFLDVGAHIGQSLSAVLNLNFDQVVCFEPAPECWPALEKLADSRTRIERFGLLDQEVQIPLNDSGLKSASLWIKDNRKAGQPIQQQLCFFQRATDWFYVNLQPMDIVYLKLNCEGAEYAILEDLLDSGEFKKVYYALVAFHGRKLSKVLAREQVLRERLKQYSTRIELMENVSGPTHQDTIRNWLKSTEIGNDAFRK